MAVNKKILELQKKREKVLLGGGEQAIEKQKAMGKRTARERIMALLDENSFNEYDMFVEHVGRDFDMEKKSLPSDGVIIGSGLSTVLLLQFLPRILQLPEDPWD